MQAEISCQCYRDRCNLLSAGVNHQVGPHDMGRTDVRTAAGGLQDVSRKCVESAMQKLSLRFAASSDFYNSVTSATRSGLVCFLNKRATIARSWRFASPTNVPNPREDFWSKTTVWNAKACCCFQTAKWTTELQTWAHPSLEARPPTLLPTPLSLQEFRQSRGVQCCD